MGKLATDSTLKKKQKQNQNQIQPSIKTHKKKKGRPSKADLARRYSTRSLHSPTASAAGTRRSLRPFRRRRGLEEEEPYFYDYDDEEAEEAEEEEDEEEEERRRRREKKLTVVLKLKRCTDGERSGGSGAHTPDPNSSGLEDDCENESKPLKKRRRINGADDDDDDVDVVVDDDNDDDDRDVRSNKSDDRKGGKRNGVSKPVESVRGMCNDSSISTTTPLPERKMLEFILHKLQKKDTYGVYAEPVDPKELIFGPNAHWEWHEIRRDNVSLPSSVSNHSYQCQVLPDYHDIIKHPMDFGTIKKKLASSGYISLEQFESDVFLVCTNAMRYNAPETIYHKQARAIQELAKKRFEKLRVAAHNEMELESAQKTRSNSMAKKSIKSICTSAHEPVGSDFSSGATLANTGDTCAWSNITQAVAFDKSGSIDGLVMDGNSLDESKHDKVEEHSVKGFQSKFGRKPFVVDENRRSTYNTSDQPVTRTESVFATFESEMKQLVVVGLHADHSYARSLARFSATLGPVAWRVASRRIEQALPTGYKFGRGWVGEYEPLQTPVLSLENHSRRQPAYNLNSEHNSESNKVLETRENSKATLDGGHKTVQLLSETSAEAVCNQTPKPSNLDGKLSWFGIVAGGKPSINDARPAAAAAELIKHELC